MDPLTEMLTRIHQANVEVISRVLSIPMQIGAMLSGTSEKAVGGRISPYSEEYPESTIYSSKITFVDIGEGPWRYSQKNLRKYEDKRTLSGISYMTDGEDIKQYPMNPVNNPYFMEATRPIPINTYRGTTKEKKIARAKFY